MATHTKAEQRKQRHQRIRSRISGTQDRPRFSVFKSNTALYVQLIDDVVSSTLASASTKEVAGKTGMERAKELGKLVAKKAQEKKIKAVVFDRGGFKFTGQIKELADSAREAGLSF